MTISKTRRRQIENKWQAESSHLYSSGEPLCLFLGSFAEEIVQPFREVWIGRPTTGSLFGSMTPAYMDKYLGSQHDTEEAYLLRALTLNMLLDDNEGEQ